jgi:hypothetical protein
MNGKWDRGWRTKTLFEKNSPNIPYSSFGKYYSKIRKRIDYKVRGSTFFNFEGFHSIDFLII